METPISTNSVKFAPSFGGSTLKQTIIFEFIGWYGRCFRRKKSKINTLHKPLLLDLGCGSNFKEGWVHVDFFSAPNFKWFVNKSKYRKPEIETDLRYPILCKNNSVDGIYCGHTIEHLYPDKAYQLINEIFRILKPNSWVRMNFPDLEKYIDFYLGKKSEREFLSFNTGCEAISMLTQNYGHHSCWDIHLISKVLSDIGFINIKKVKFGEEGSDLRLIKEEAVRKWETLVVEAQKPPTS
jgi:hypothetical protein